MQQSSARKEHMMQSPENRAKQVDSTIAEIWWKKKSNPS